MSKLKKIFKRRHIPEHRLRELFWARDSELLEMACALSTSLWAFWLSLWAIIGIRDAGPIHFLISRGFWGGLLTVIAILQWYSLLTGCASGRRHTAFVAACIWYAILAQACFTALHFTPAASALAFALLHSAVYIRLRVLPPRDLVTGWHGG